MLQERDFFEAEGLSCSGRVSTFQFQCWSNPFLLEQRWEQVPEIHIPFPITVAECRRMHSQQKFKDENGKNHQIKTNSVNTILYSSVGAVYVKDMNAYCAGEKMIRGDQVKNDLVVMKSLQLTLRTNVNLRFNENHSVNRDTGVLIPCTMKENACYGEIITYLWDEVDTSCNVVHLKNARGTITARSTFISHDDNLFINLGKELITDECDFPKFKTNLPGIFVVRQPQQKLHLKQMKAYEADDFRVIDFVIARDNYVDYLGRMRMSQSRITEHMELCNLVKNSKQSDMAISQQTGE